MEIEEAKTLDKFYTNKDVADRCATIYNKYVERGTEVVEPSAGAGVFAPYVTRMLDIAPEGPKIEQIDFMDFNTTTYKNYLGNPPFGKNSSLAIKFFNHASKGKGIIGFIVPRTFRKHSVKNKLNLNFHLQEEMILEESSFTLNGKAYSVPCVFQVWKYFADKKRCKELRAVTHPDFSFVARNQCDFSMRRVGGNAGKINPHNNYADASNYFIKGECREAFAQISSKLQELAKNTAGNPSISKAEIVEVYKNHCREE